MFKRPVYVVVTRTTYNINRIYKDCVEETIQTICTSERKAIGYVEGFIKGFIASSKDKPDWFKDKCIKEIPTHAFIKKNDITLYKDDLECKKITYFEFELE